MKKLRKNFAPRRKKCPNLRDGCNRFDWLADNKIRFRRIVGTWMRLHLNIHLAAVVVAVDNRRCKRWNISERSKEADNNLEKAPQPSMEAESIDDAKEAEDGDDEAVVSVPVELKKEAPLDTNRANILQPNHLTQSNKKILA